VTRYYRFSVMWVSVYDCKYYMRMFFFLCYALGQQFAGLEIV